MKFWMTPEKFSFSDRKCGLCPLFWAIVWRQHCALSVRVSSVLDLASGVKGLLLELKKEHRFPGKQTSFVWGKPCLHQFMLGGVHEALFSISVALMDRTVADLSGIEKTPIIQPLRSTISWRPPRCVWMCDKVRKNQTGSVTRTVQFANYRNRMCPVFRVVFFLFQKMTQFRVFQAAAWIGFAVWLLQVILALVRYYRNRKLRSADNDFPDDLTTSDTREIAREEPTA